MNLPPLAIRQRIASTTHEAVVARYGENNAATLCRAYAAIGCEMANRLTGRVYRVESGHLGVRGPGYWLRTDHAWFVRQEGDRYEIVDLASRNWPRLAEMAGAPGPIEAREFVWCWSDDIPEGVSYGP